MLKLAKNNLEISKKIQAHFDKLCSLDIRQNLLVTSDILGSVRLWTTDLEIIGEFQTALSINQNLAY